MDFPYRHGGNSREAVSDVAACVCILSVHMYACIAFMHASMAKAMDRKVFTWCLLFNLSYITDEPPI